MRKIKDVLRLKLEAGLTHEQVAAALRISKGVATKYLTLASAAGLDWVAMAAMDEAELEPPVDRNRFGSPATPCPTTAASTRSCGARA